MQVYTELVAPSAVTHSLSLPLTSAAASNLVVAKGSLVQIFATRTVAAEFDPQFPPEPPAAARNEQQQPDADIRGNDDEAASLLGGGETLLLPRDRAHHTKLVLVAEIPVAGTVIGLARLRLQNTA